MVEQTSIEWADHTFNPWEGCQKVGPGCDHCYAEARNARFGGGVAANWGPGAPRRRTSEANWRKPLRWNADAARFAEANGGRRQRVFCASLADVFDNAVDPQWRDDLFDLIDRTSNLDWLLLTKRIGNVSPMLRLMNRHALPAYVWLGATVVNQAEFDRDLPKLLMAPAENRFLSCEPLLGPVDLSKASFVDADGDEVHYSPLDGEGIMFEHAGDEAKPIELASGYMPVVAWVIAGGESGAGARPMHPDWARSLRDQCARAGVPFLFKQWGEWAPPSAIDDQHEDAIERAYFGCFVDGEWSGACSEEWARKHGYIVRVGKGRAGRMLDGVRHDGFPL